MIVGGAPRPDCVLWHIDNITKAVSLIAPRRASHKNSATLA
jgi:hypothetical protein